MRERTTPRGSVMTFKALANGTGGVFSFMEREMPAGGMMTPPHRHAGPEVFYVLDGTLEFRVNDEVVHGRAGSFVLVPETVAHTFGNTSGEPARLLIKQGAKTIRRGVMLMHMPAAGAYFAELQDLWSSPTPPTVEQERELQRRHGLEPA